MSYHRVLVIITDQSPSHSDKEQKIDWKRPQTMMPRVLFGWSTEERVWLSLKWRDLDVHATSFFEDAIPVNDVTFLREVDDSPLGVRGLHCTTHARNGDPVMLSTKNAFVYQPESGEDCVALIKQNFTEKLAGRILRCIPSEAIWQPGFNVRFRVGDERHDAKATGFSIDLYTGVIRIIAENTESFHNGFTGVSFLRRAHGEGHWTWVISKMERVVDYAGDGEYSQEFVPAPHEETAIPLDHVIFQVPGDLS